jgi:hypothetical protein
MSCPHKHRHFCCCKIQNLGVKKNICKTVCCRSEAVAPARQHADAVKGDAEPRAPAWKRPRAVLAVAALGWSGDPRGASLPPPLLALARAARAFVVGPQLHGRTMRADRAHRGVGGQRSAEREPVDQVAELWARDGELEMVPYVRHGEGAVRCGAVRARRARRCRGRAANCTLLRGFVLV